MLQDPSEHHGVLEPVLQLPPGCSTGQLPEVQVGLAAQNQYMLIMLCW
jgi:hypothetical protein